MKRITTFFKWLFWLFKGKIPTIDKAIAMGLTHETNIFGDAILMTGCRSYWNDEYGRRFGCEELLDNGRDVIMEQIEKEHPNIFKP